MRTRLIAVLLVPMTVVLLALGGAYAWNVARTIQIEAANQQAAELSYFLTGARQALRAGSPDIIAGELSRYSELYGARIAVFDRSGALWASGGPVPDAVSDATENRLRLALSGRRSDPPAPVMPWALTQIESVEPVFDDGNVIGAAAIVASAEPQRTQTLLLWAALVGVCAAVIALLLLAAVRLANWVLRPMTRVDAAMAAIEHGEMGARISDDTGPPEMRRMIGMFNRMADEIERVISRQQEFAMNASHELRNPLGALLLRVEYLATGLDERWDAEVEQTREEGRRMSRILDTLLSMARAGQHDSAFAVVDLAEVAAARAEAWRDVAGERGVTFAVDHAGPALSTTDRTSVETALDAVIDNAVKFAPAGSAIEITVHGGSDVCVIAVRDHGPGLPEGDLDLVTGRFWRSARDQNVAGSGLGLAIANDLLDALNGSLAVTAPDGGGLRVALTLPGVTP
ncbi:sensor histidine kinase [Leucobacter chromiireducens]|uniref:sensor histidine kinase n=1 Tax=Leucobacter chromiireducens TaxID=283877 RepID=UPI000F636B3E|nr:HAMP domain-containing sensor histidine kinase [Leucobacter chromiireducens]